MCTGQERSQYPDGHPAVHNTGGQPTPEAVEQAAMESGQVAMSREHWILVTPWWSSKYSDGIFCMEPLKSGQEFRPVVRVMLGGLESVRRHIVDLHNRAIGFPDAVPSRDAEVA